VRALALAALLATSSAAQQFETGGMVGYSVTDGDDQTRSANPIYGASFRWPAGTGHSLQADYSFIDFEARIYSRHFITGSWVRAARRGTVRPFFQAGAGVYIENTEIQLVKLPPGVPRSALQTTSTDFCLVFGTGATVDLGSGFFLRPMLRAYLYVGPTLTYAPAITAGVRF